MDGYLSAPLGAMAEQALWCHYEQLSIWNRRVSLVGPGAWGELLARHYGESLAALAWVRESDRRLLDIGSGGGFPGIVLAAGSVEWVGASGPISEDLSFGGIHAGLEVTLVEPREKKWAFLSTVARKARLSCQVVNARVGSPLPAPLEASESFDIITSRALAISPEIFRAIAHHSPSARFLLWRGRESFEPPGGYEQGRILDLEAGEHRRLVEIRPILPPREIDARDSEPPTIDSYQQS